MNSWAAVSLWKRCLNKEEDAGENKEKESCPDSNALYQHDDYTDEDTSSTPDYVRSEWARRELSDFCRSTSSRDYSQGSSRIDERVRVSNPQLSASITTPSTGPDHPDLRVNGMFLPQ